MGYLPEERQKLEQFFSQYWFELLDAVRKKVRHTKDLTCGRFIKLAKAIATEKNLGQELVNLIDERYKGQDIWRDQLVRMRNALSEDKESSKPPIFETLPRPPSEPPPRPLFEPSLPPPFGMDYEMDFEMSRDRRSVAPPPRDRRPDPPPPLRDRRPDPPPPLRDRRPDPPPPPRDRRPDPPPSDLPTLPSGIPLLSPCCIKQAEQGLKISNADAKKATSHRNVLKRVYVEDCKNELGLELYHCTKGSDELGVKNSNNHHIKGHANVVTYFYARQGEADYLIAYGIHVDPKKNESRYCIQKTVTGYEDLQGVYVTCNKT